MIDPFDAGRAEKKHMPVDALWITGLWITVS